MKTLQHAVILAFTVCISSCTPAFSVRLFNRSTRDIVVLWQSDFAYRVPAARDKIVGSASDYSSPKHIVVISAGRGVEYSLPASPWDAPTACIRAMHFPAAAGSRELCVEYSADGSLRLLDAKSLMPLAAQPEGFPLKGMAIPELPNHSPEATPGQRPAAEPSPSSGAPQR